MFKRNKKPAYKSCLDDCIHELNALLDIAGNENIKNELNLLKDKLRYLFPAQNEAEASAEEKLLNRIGDLKIEIVRANRSKQYDAANKVLTDIKIAIAERGKGFNE